ncbi:MAG: hypothetical protein WDM78_00660 [Puia sp.]
MGLLRLIFYFVFNHAGNPVSTLGSSFLLGFRFDLKMICFLLEFMLLLGALNISDPFFSSRSRKGYFILLAIVCLITSFTYTVDFAHYSYLNLRLSASVLNYMQGCGYFPDPRLGNLSCDPHVVINPDREYFDLVDDSSNCFVPLPVQRIKAEKNRNGYGWRLLLYCFGLEFLEILVNTI